jgi:hypothetical protein
LSALFGFVAIENGNVTLMQDARSTGNQDAEMSLQGGRVPKSITAWVYG